MSVQMTGDNLSFRGLAKFSSSLAHAGHNQSSTAVDRHRAPTKSAGHSSNHFNPIASSTATMVQQPDIEQQNRMKGWILEQEYYLEHSRLANGMPILPTSSSPVTSIGQMSQPDMDSEDSNFSKRKNGRDPLSHRIIEKRRRDRMNLCLTDLSKLIPPAYLKKGKGRIEKTEIVEMAIKHLKYLEGHRGNTNNSNCVQPCPEEEKRKHFQLGFQEAMSEAIRFLVELEGHFAGDGLCLRMVDHLHKHVDALNDHKRPVSTIKHTNQNLMAGHQQKMTIKPTISPAVSATTQIVINDSKPMEGIEEQRLMSSMATINNNLPASPFTGSQLRKMLEAKEINNQQSQLKASKLASPIVAPVSSLSPAMSMKSSPSPIPGSPAPASESGGRKNYKKEIKERFQATMSGSSSSSTGSKSSNSLNSVGVKFDGLQSDTSPESASPANEEHSPESSSRYEMSSSTGVAKSDCSYASYSKNHSGQTVPGFALHPTGSYYVPVRLEPMVVARFVAADNQLIAANNSTHPALHPISIAVSFANCLANPIMNRATQVFA